MTPQVAADKPARVEGQFTNNRWSGARYDGGTPSAGNQTAIGGYAFSYDAENRLKTSTINSATTTYSYDGEGRRVKKVGPSGTTVYVYDAFGELAAEYGPLAAVGGPQFLTADHLGSTRLVTNSAGQRLECHDYLPFGEELTINRDSCYAASASVTLKFTGKERDTESGLDYFGARYFSPQQGRFTSPDPLLNSGRPWLPQSWNRYAYALNNPLKYVDPDGLFEWAANCAQGDTKCEAERKRFTDALERLGTAAARHKEGSNERKALENVLSLFGQPGEKNGVFVGFGYAKGAVGLEWKEGDRVNVRLDLNLFDERVSAWARSDKRLQPDVELSGVVAHEGTHARDAYLYGNNYMMFLGRPAVERSAFDAQSYVNKSFNAFSPYGLWNPSWAQVDQATQERRRIEAVKRNAERGAKLGEGIR